MTELANVASAIAAAVSAAVAAYALLLVQRQITLQVKQLKFEALTRLHDILISDQMHQDLRLIYSSTSEQLAAPSSREVLGALERVLATYDLVAYRVLQDVLPKDAILRTEWPVLLRLWARAHLFVKEERRRRGGVPYKNDLEWLVNEAEIYRSTRYPNAVVEVFSRTDESLKNNAEREESSGEKQSPTQ